MNRQTFATILDDSVPEGEPVAFALKALREAYPSLWGKDAREVASALVLDHKWQSYDQPQYTAFWRDEKTGRCGFVWKRVVNGGSVFQSIDNTGKGHRVDGNGFQYVALKPPG
jgi:hypothetical protein